MELTELIEVKVSALLVCSVFGLLALSVCVSWKPVDTEVCWSVAFSRVGNQLPPARPLLWSNSVLLLL